MGNMRAKVTVATAVLLVGLTAGCSGTSEKQTNVDTAVTLACPHYGNIISDAGDGALVGSALSAKLVEARDNASNWPKLYNAIDAVVSDVAVGDNVSLVSDGAEVFDICAEGESIIES